MVFNDEGEVEPPEKVETTCQLGGAEAVRLGFIESEANTPPPITTATKITPIIHFCAYVRLLVGVGCVVGVAGKGANRSDPHDWQNFAESGFR